MHPALWPSSSSPVVYGVLGVSLLRLSDARWVWLCTYGERRRGGWRAPHTPYPCLRLLYAAHALILCPCAAALAACAGTRCARRPAAASTPRSVPAASRVTTRRIAGMCTGYLLAAVAGPPRRAGEGGVALWRRPTPRCPHAWDVPFLHRGHNPPSPRQRGKRIVSASTDAERHVSHEPTVSGLSPKKPSLHRHEPASTRMGHVGRPRMPLRARHAHP